MRLTWRLVVCLAATGLSWSVAAETTPQRPGPGTPRFVEDGVVSTNEGHTTLRWTLPEAGDAIESDPIFELEHSRDPSFADARPRHRGPQRAFFVSGLQDGRNYFRVRATAAGSAAGSWSEVLVVEVDYPDRGQVALLLAIGGLVFAGTVVAIVAGWRRAARREPAANGAQA